mgnify:CR=1 FL=1
MKRLPAFALVTALPLLFAPALLRGGDDPQPADAEASKTILAADLKKDLTYIASDELEGRATPSPGQDKAAAFLAKRFEELKLEPGGSDATYRQKIPFTPRKRGGDAASAPAPVEIANIVGILRGTDPKAGAIVFSAHYDHIGKNKPKNPGDPKEDIINNGADDDGSGTVSVLALAKAYAARKTKPKRSLVFACFTGEEIGGVGSRAYVGSPAIPLGDTICDINLEMLGRTHDIGPKRAWVTGWDVSTLGPILAKGGKAAGVEIYPDPYPQEGYYMRSDNASFVAKKVIGQTVSAGSNHPDYHTVRDEVGKIEFENLEALVRAVYLGSARIASGEETPKPTGDSLMPKRK